MDQGNAASASIPPKLGFSLDGEEALRDTLTTGHTGKGWIWAARRMGTRRLAGRVMPSSA